MIELDGREVKEGDRMWNPVFGWMTVSYEPENKDYPLYMENDCFGSSVTKHGSIDLHLPRCLFWDEIDMTPPKPKQKVKKWRWDYEVRARGYKLEGISKHCTAQEITEKAILNRWYVIGKIESTEVEVEE